IAIPYFGVKTQGLLRDVGLSELLLEVKDLSLAVLKEKVERCFNGNDALRSKVQAVAQQRYAAAMSSGQRLAGIVDEFERKSQRQRTAHANTNTFTKAYKQIRNKRIPFSGHRQIE